MGKNGLTFRGPAAEILVAVGSHNPLKLAATRSVIRRVFPEAEFVAVASESGVSINPSSNRETIIGARTRAKTARGRAGADWGIGLEGGITRVGKEWFTCVWGVIWDGKDETRGGGVHFQLPPLVLKGILQNNTEMGTGIDKLTGMRMTKRRMGAEGILTNGLIDRKDTFETTLIYALAPRLSRKYYLPPRHKGSKKKPQK